MLGKRRDGFMIVCGGFALGSTTLGGSTIKLCTDCIPNLIVVKEEGLENIGQQPFIDHWYKYTQ